MIKKYIKDLRIGDEILKFDRGWMSTDFLTHRVKVGSASVIKRLEDNGIEFVYIKPRKAEVQKIDDLFEGKHEEVIEEAQEEAVEQLNLKELHIASEVYTESVKIIGDVLSDVRSGKMFNTGAVKHVAENIAQLTLRNKGVLASVTKLKQFDNYTFHHSMNVSIFAASLAAHLKLDEKEIAIAANSGIMHDVGKMLVPENILNKPSKLTAEEFAIMKTHVELGYDIIKQSGEDMSSKGLVMEHHERHDGSGYPQGLKDEQISIQGKIGAVVDIYDAITSDRVYHKGMAATSALKLMFQWADKHINKSVFEFFIKNIGIYPVGSLVIMATQELAMVGKINNGRPTDPVVVVFMGKNGERLPIKVVDLSKSGVDRQKIIGLINPENVSVPKEVYRYIDSMNRIS